MNNNQHTVDSVDNFVDKSKFFILTVT